MKEEWHELHNFKETYDELKKLIKETGCKQRISEIIMMKYTESALSYYTQLKLTKPCPAHFYVKNVVDFIAEAYNLTETLEFKNVFSNEFNAFLSNHNDISIENLKSSLANNDLPRLFELLHLNYTSFHQEVSTTISLFDKKLDEINHLFIQFPLMFPHHTHVFNKEFNYS